MLSDERVYIIAEIGINHNGDLAIAKELVEAAATAGADAVKFQFWEATELSSDPETVELLRSWELEPHEWEDVARTAASADVDFFASVFDEASVDQLVAFDPPAIKVASGDVTNVPLLESIAATKTPVIMSTGMAVTSEIATAVETIRRYHDEVSLLHCVSSYPVDIDALNLRAMDTLRSAFDVPVGFSDHTKGTLAPALAVARGARIVEKHVTLDRDMEGPDHSLSLEPPDLEEMVERIRTVESGLGDGRLVVEPTEEESKTSMRRGLTARTDIPEGEELTRDDVKMTRPETGISPAHLETVVGRTARRSIERDQPIRWTDV